MDNKLFKRIVAVAASAVMLTTSAFATVLTVGEDAWNDTAKSLTFSYDPAGATKVTYLAYAAREAAKGENGEYTEAGTDINGTKYVFGEIVAVNQIDSASGALAADTLSVPVNGDLLVVGEDAATNIVLMSGSDIATTADTKVVALTQAPVEYTITFDVDGVTSTATTVEGKVTAPAAPTKDGFTFKGWGTTADATTVVDLSTEIFAADTTLYAIFEANAPTYTYNVTVQDVAYNGSAKVLRLTGLDPAAVSVKVGSTVGQYYTRTTDSEKVIVLCVATDANVDYADVDAVKALITIEEGTTSEIKYGNANGDTSILPSDVTQLKRECADFTFRGTTFTLPTDLMELHLRDVNADGKVLASDATLLQRSIAEFTFRGTTFTIPTMTCYTK